jgi:hypothetical protein
METLTHPVLENMSGSQEIKKNYRCKKFVSIPFEPVLQRNVKIEFKRYSIQL